MQKTPRATANNGREQGLPGRGRGWDLCHVVIVTHTPFLIFPLVVPAHRSGGSGVGWAGRGGGEVGVAVARRQK